MTRIRTNDRSPEERTRLRAVVRARFDAGEPFPQVLAELGLSFREGWGYLDPPRRDEAARARVEVVVEVVRERGPIGTGGIVVAMRERGWGVDHKTAGPIVDALAAEGRIVNVRAGKRTSWAVRADVDPTAGVLYERGGAGRRFVTPQLVEEATALRRAGMSMNAVAVRLEVSFATLARHLPEELQGPRPLLLPKEDQVAAAELRAEEGYTYTELAAQFGVAPHVMTHHVKANRPWGRPEYVRAAWDEAYAKGVPVREIAEAEGVSGTTVYRYLRVPRRPTGRADDSHARREAWLEQIVDFVAEHGPISARVIQRRLFGRGKSPAYSLVMLICREAEDLGVLRNEGGYRTLWVLN